MKRIVKISFLLLAMMGVLFTSCKKDYPEPPIQNLPVGTIYTIAEILDMESGTVFNEDASVYGIVTADEQSGNLYKAAFIQDRASGAALELHLNAVSGLRIGDSIRVYLKDVTYSLYANLPQLTNFEPDGHIIILANNKPIEPAKATIAEINQGKYLAGLVRLENVKFTEQNTFADPSTYGNRTLADPTDYSQTVIVRTSNYANFAYDSLPQGTGSLTAIASVYNNTWQLYIRSAKELKFEGYEPGGEPDLPYYQDFTSSFGTYTTYDVLGSQSWVIDYNTAKMTGYENNTNYANEDWLISRKFSLEGVSNASLTMTYIARYFNDLDNDIAILVSDNYTSGDPNEASWSKVPASWTSGSNWTDFASTTLDLSNYVGKKINVAVRYISTDAKAGTIEVQSILIQEGSGPGPGPGPQPGGELQYMPYTQSFETEFGTYTTYDVLGPQSWEIDYKTAKMTGYAGGSHANEDWLLSSPVAITGVDHAKVSVTYSAQYQSSDPNDVALLVSTDYVYGSDPLTASWTLTTATYPNTANFNDFQTVETSLDYYLGQNVTVALRYTSTDSQSRTIEVKSITVQEGEAGGGVGPTPPPGPGTGSGTANDPYNVTSGISLQGQGEGVWVQGYIVGAVKNGNTSVNSNDQINWGAPFDLNTNVVIADDPSCHEINNCIIVNLPNGKPLRTEVNLVDHPDNLGKQLAVCGTLRTYFGQAGLRDSNGTESDFVLQGGTPPPPGPGTGSGTANDPYNIVSGIGLQDQGVTGWVQGYIVGVVKSSVSSVNSNSDVNWNGSFDSQTNVVIADNPSCQEITQCLFVHLTPDTPLRNQVNLMNHPENLGKMLAVRGNLRTYYGQAGLRDSNGSENDFTLGGDTPTPPSPTGIFSETFANGQGDFTIVDVNLSGLNYVWAYMNNFQCMKANGYYQSAHETESWLVSPQINLSNVSSATLRFDQAIAFAEGQGSLHIMASKDYSGNVTTANWTELNIGTWPAPSSNWVFETSTADLTGFVGQNVTIAFKYTSTLSACPAWEVKNVVVE